MQSRPLYLALQRLEDLDLVRTRRENDGERPRLYATATEAGTRVLAYLAPTRVNLNLTQERWPEVRFFATREH